MRTRPRLIAALLFPLALVACDERAPDDMLAAEPAALATLPENAAFNKTIAQLRSATARYHDINAAIDDGFVFLHECEDRPGEGPVGIVYVNIERLVDGIVDPSAPDALLYEPGKNGQLRLTGAELAIPYALWTEPDPPEFLGASFQREDEFGVFGLHVWIWRHNPDGMFATGNPRISCAAET